MNTNIQHFAQNFPMGEKQHRHIAWTIENRKHVGVSR